MTLGKRILVSGVLLSLLSASCIFRPATVIVDRGSYYLADSADFAHVGKVVIVELENSSTVQEIGPMMSEAVCEALQKKNIFAVRTIYPGDDEWEKAELDGIGTFAPERIVSLKEQLNADAVVVGTVTQYYPFPHLLVGLNLKMVDTRRGRILWAMEQVWDSSDKSIEYRIKLYSKDYMRSGYEPYDWELFTTSPRAFNKFVAAEVAQTFSWGVQSTRFRASADSGDARRYVR